MLVTNDDAAAEKARLLRSHGMTTLSFERAKGHASTYDVVSLGYNYRLDDIRAAIGLAQIKKFETLQEKRKYLLQNYHELLSKIKGVTIPFLSQKISSYHLIPILVAKSKREEVRHKFYLCHCHPRIKRKRNFSA